MTDETRVDDLVRAVTWRYADLACADELTYAQLGARIDRLCAGWRADGLRPGELVAVQAGDRTGLVVALLALLCYGAVPLILHHDMPGDQVRHCVELARPQFLIGSEAHAGADRLRLGARLYQRHALSAPGVALVASTSGTTTAPKLVQHSHAAMLANVAGIRSYIDLRPGDHVLILREPSYLSVFVGEVLVAIASGCALHMLPRTISASGLAARVEQSRAAFMVGTATLFHLALPSFRQHAADLRSLRAVLLVGEGAHIETLAQLQALLPESEVFHCYGLTEAGPRLTYWSARRDPHQPFCVGWPLPGVAVRAQAEAGAAAGPGVLEVQSPSMMLGYVGQPPLGDPWLPTSDWGWVDEAGRVYVQGRVDDIIVRAGVKVSPTLIEHTLLGHRAVQAALAKGERREAYATQISAFVVLHPGEQVAERELLALCRQSLPSSAWPSRVFVVDELPRTSGGKLKRN